MILLVLLASVLIAVIAIFQYKEETQDYHKQRLERKEQSVKTHINRVVILLIIFKFSKRKLIKIQTEKYKKYNSCLCFKD